MNQKRIAAIHDISCVGRCSLTAALPILSAAGFETNVLPTAILSTQTDGFDDYTFLDLSQEIRPIYCHWNSLGLHFDALYSGFLGSFKQIELLTEMFSLFHTPDCMIMVDPVMGDAGKLYGTITRTHVHKMAGLCAMANIIVPNLTEAAFLLGETYRPGPYDVPHIESQLRRLTELGPQKAVLSGVYFDKGHIGAAAYDKESDEFSYAFTPRLNGFFPGTGDIFASTVLAALLRDFPLKRAIQIGTAYIHRCIMQTDTEPRRGVCFEQVLPWLMEQLGLF